MNPANNGCPACSVHAAPGRGLSTLGGRGFVLLAGIAFLALYSILPGQTYQNLVANGSFNGGSIAGWTSVPGDAPNSQGGGERWSGSVDGSAANPSNLAHNGRSTGLGLYNAGIAYVWEDLADYRVPSQWSVLKQSVSGLNTALNSSGGLEIWFDLRWSEGNPTGYNAFLDVTLNGVSYAHFATVGNDASHLPANAAALNGGVLDGGTLGTASGSATLSSIPWNTWERYKLTIPNYLGPSTAELGFVLTTDHVLGSGTSYSSDDYYLDNVIVPGLVAVPEPSGALLLGLAGCVSLLLYRRRSSVG